MQPLESDGIPLVLLQRKVAIQLQRERLVRPEAHVGMLAANHATKTEFAALRVKIHLAHADVELDLDALAID